MEKEGKERILTPIRMGEVRSRFPYYIKCSYCGAEIAGSSPEEVAEKANVRGWKYDYYGDFVVCPDCLKRTE